MKETIVFHVLFISVFFIIGLSIGNIIYANRHDDENQIEVTP